jgi:hypothetical protein
VPIRARLTCLCCLFQVFFLAEQYAINKRKHEHLFDPKDLESAFNTPVGVYVNESGRDPFVAVDAKITLADLCEQFFKYGIRRVPVALHSKIVASISQSGAVNTEARARSLMSPAAQM